MIQEPTDKVIEHELVDKPDIDRLAEEFAEDPPRPMQEPEGELDDAALNEAKPADADALYEEDSTEGNEPQENIVENEDSAVNDQEGEIQGEDEDEDEQEENESELAESIETTVDSVIEAILFASDEPLTPQRLVNTMETGSVKQVRQAVRDLNRKYRQNGHAFRIEKIAGGYQMMTLPAYNHWLKKMLRVRTDNKLSPAALETLAIVSYKQPIIRADIEAIRGVASGEVLRNLMYKGLIKMVGRAEVLGRPMLYGTTRKFLDTFGLGSLKDLPKVEELKRPDQ
ncbi:MAG: SMC-Scp complex subunit ScpB [Sedimentisphaerales bacterium]|nr:SMC-Scp complex subunit ScpB [Sedimentisphaerales bacterium]